MDVKIMNEEKISDVEFVIKYIKNGFPNSEGPAPIQVIPGEFTIYHYTSTEKLFSILAGDAIWASRSRFSNDSTEDHVLGEEWVRKNQYYGDNYILCFCNQDDSLNQWRAYCPKGGAAIGFHFPAGYNTYTLLHQGYRESDPLVGEYCETYKNRPIPVVYCEPQRSSRQVPGVNIHDLLELFKTEKVKERHLQARDIVPYLKNGFFRDEQELRLVFDNSNDALANCIRFRKQDDGVLVPYIVVKFGNQLEMGQRLSFSYTEEQIEKVFDDCVKGVRRKTITIPCGIDQSAICAQFTEKIYEYQKEIFDKPAKWERWKKNPAKIVCEGHLPVVSITVSPSANQEMIAEKIAQFCKSKYWLRNVQVKCSEIPYIAPQL